MTIIRKENFHHPLIEVTLAGTHQGIDEDTMNFWATASYLCYEAAIGNVKAIAMIEDCILTVNPLANYKPLLDKARENDQAATRLLINWVVNGLEAKTDAAFNAG